MLPDNCLVVTSQVAGQSHVPNQACNKKNVAASHDAGNTSTNESREACRNTPGRLFVSGSHSRERFRLRWERQTSFLRDERKHLVVVLGLSADYSATKRCSVVSMGRVRSLGMQRPPGNSANIIRKDVTLP